MTTAKVNIKFLQQPLNNQNFNYVVEENSIPIQTINKTFKAPITQNSSRIVKINGEDMTVINSFNVGTGFNNVGVGVNRMVSAIQSDGKILVGGGFTAYNGTTSNRIIRLNTNGSVDSTFNIGIGFNGVVNDIKIQSDGKILVVGFFTSYNGTTKNRIVRLNTNGSVDSTFNIGTGFNLEAERIAIQSDGKILVVGQFTNYNGTAKNCIIRLNTNGTYDSSFAITTGIKYLGGTSLTIQAIKIQADGKILVGGLFDEYNGTLANKIVRINSNGSIDGTFISGSGVGGNVVREIEILPSGKILLCGLITTYNEIPINEIIRLNTNGTIDLSFSTGSGLNTGGYFRDIEVQSNGDIICAGSFDNYNGNNRNFILKIDEDGNYISDSLQFNAGTVYLNRINDAEVIVLGDFISATSPAVQTTTDIPIGLTVNDTINFTQINLNTFNAQSGVTYVVSGDTVLHQVDYDSTINLLSINNVNDIPSYVIITFEDGIIALIGDIIIAGDDSPLSPTNIINPAYNNTILRWSSNLTNTAYSEVIINGKTFKVYPMNNSFIYNFKDMAKDLINENYFKDVIIPDLYITDIYDDSTLSLTLPVTINLWNTLGQFLTKNLTLKFIKSVEQLPNYANKLVSAPDVRILLPTTNYTDYYLPYFEGYPCDFAVYGITSNDTYYLKNISNYNQTDTLSGTTNEVKRFYLSDGFTDGSVNEDLNLASTQNKVELWVNGSFVNNLIIDKKESKCGVYLRWFNNTGSYSYWLFDEPYQEATQYRMIDDIQGVYDNLQSVSSSSEIIGKTGNRTIKLKTKFNLNQKEYLESLLSSAKVEMYSYNKPFASPIDSASFFGVKVNDGSFPFNSKNTNNTLELTITMPDINTQTL